jgi:hypothetical protein
LRGSEGNGTIHHHPGLRDTCSIAATGKDAGQAPGHAEMSLSHGQKNDAAVRTQSSSVEIGRDFLAATDRNKNGKIA